MATTYPTASSAMGPETVVPFAHADSVFTVERTFDLTSLALLVTSDVVNLLSLPANTVILAASLKVVSPATQSGGGTQTLTLRFGTTAITGALDALTAGITVGGYANSLPASVGTSAAYLNVLDTLATGTTTKNAVIKVCLLCADLG